ncbi:MAG: cytochrome b5 domain-containing protein, partial [Candidatus Paceibacterota bacterium]
MSETEQTQEAERVQEKVQEKAEDRAVEKKQVIISYQGELYDVTNFSHPGEGAGVYLSDYNGKEVDEEIENSHMTDQPQCMLAQAKKKDFYGIKYLGTK